MRILPPKKELIQHLGVDDFFLWGYYGKGFFGRIQAWIFSSRVKVLMEFLRKTRQELGSILDVGCGPMFVSYSLIGNAESEYVGVDVMPADRLKKYRDAMRGVGVKVFEVVRASAESLPFRDGVFGFALSLDVLEHLGKPKQAATEIHKVVRNEGLVAISLPLENLTQKLLRIGFFLMNLGGNTVLNKMKHIPITRTPDYHYIGDVKSYNDMVEVLKDSFHFMYSKYTPIGLHKSINVNAVHIASKEAIT